MSMIRAIGFDLDGTLIDHVGSSVQAVNALVAALDGTPPEDVHHIWFAIEAEQFELWRSGQIGFQEQRRRRLQAFLPTMGVEAPANDTALDDLFARYLDAYKAAWRLFPGVTDLLTALRDEGYRLGILTNGAREQQMDKLTTTSLLPLIDVVCVSEELGVQKPDERAFRALTGRLEVDPAQCLFVGDNPHHDIAGAESVGMPALLVDHYGDDPLDLESAVRTALTA